MPYNTVNRGLSSPAPTTSTSFSTSKRSNDQTLATPHRTLHNDAQMSNNPSQTSTSQSRNFGTKRIRGLFKRSEGGNEKPTTISSPIIDPRLSPGTIRRNGTRVVRQETVRQNERPVRPTRPVRDPELDTREPGRSDIRPSTMTIRQVQPDRSHVERSRNGNTGTIKPNDVPGGSILLNESTNTARRNGNGTVRFPGLVADLTTTDVRSRGKEKQSSRTSISKFLNPNKGKPTQTAVVQNQASVIIQKAEDTSRGSNVGTGNRYSEKDGSRRDRETIRLSEGMDVAGLSTPARSGTVTPKAIPENAADHLVSRSTLQPGSTTVLDDVKAGRAGDVSSGTTTGPIEETRDYPTSRSSSRTGTSFTIHRLTPAEIASRSRASITHPVEQGGRYPVGKDMIPPRSSSRLSGSTLAPETNPAESPKHFILRMAVTYLVKTILPELRAERNSPEPRHASLIEYVRPLERLERAWGFDWMLRGKEGMTISARTREKERDALRKSLQDGTMLVFLLNRNGLHVATSKSPSKQLDLVAQTCSAHNFTLEEDQQVKTLSQIDGVGVYTAAAVVIALARYAGPVPDRRDSGEGESEEESDDTQKQRDSYTANRTVASSYVKKEAESPPRGTKASEPTNQPPSPVSTPWRDGLPKTTHAPAYNRISLNSQTRPTHVKLETVMSINPEEYPSSALTSASGGLADSALPLLSGTSQQSINWPPTPLQTTSGLPFRHHSRVPTPSLISGTTNRSSMALSDPPERGPRTISFAAVEEDARQRFKASVGLNLVHDPPTPSIVGDSPANSPVKYRPRVRRGVSLEPNVNPGETLSESPTRRSAEPGRPQFGPRRHSAQTGRTFIPKRSESPMGMEQIAAKPIRKQSGSFAQSPPMTPRRAMSPTSLVDSPFMPSSRRTSFNSVTSQTPSTRETVRTSVTVQLEQGGAESYVCIHIRKFIPGRANDTTPLLAIG